MTKLDQNMTGEYALYSGKDRVVRVRNYSDLNGDNPVNIAGARFLYYIRTRAGATPEVTKDSDNGTAEIEIADAANGVINIYLDSTDTDPLEDGFYVHSLEVVDVNGETSTVMEGEIEVRY